MYPSERRVLLYCDSPDGTESIHGVRFPGQILEHCAHAFETGYPVSARALVTSVLYRVSAAVARETESADPEMAAFVQLLLRLDLHNAARFIVALKTTSIADRLEHALRLIGAALGRTPNAAGDLGTPVPLRDEQFADLLGCSSRQFKRVKKNLQQQGRLSIHGKTVILHARPGQRRNA